MRHQHQKNSSTMAEPNARPDGMAIGISGRPTPETSSRWVGRGHLRRVLFNSLNRLRKKNIYWIHLFYIILAPLPTRPPQNDQMHPPPFVPRRSRLISYPSPVAPAYFWLVVASFELVRSHLRPRRVFFLFFFLLRFDARFRETTPPHTFRPGRVSSPTSPPTSKPTFIWLLCPPFKWRPSKANGPPASLNFCHLIRRPTDD
jgi:hypothetical protein